MRQTRRILVLLAVLTVITSGCLAPKRDFNPLPDTSGPTADTGDSQQPSDNTDVAVLNDFHAPETSTSADAAFAIFLQAISNPPTSRANSLAAGNAG